MSGNYNININVRAVVAGQQAVRQLTLNIQQAQAAAGGARGGIAGLGQSFQAGATSATGFGRALIGANLAALAIAKGAEIAVGAIGSFADGVKDFISEGIRMNAQMETVTLSIQAVTAASLISSGAVKDTGKAFALAGPAAQSQMEKLRIEALLTTATFEGLATALQQAIGPGLAKGLNLDQIRQLTVQIGQAAKSLGMPDYQIPQEVRALLEGRIDRNARVGKALQITSADIAKFKGDAQGLFDFLDGRTKAFKLSGELAAKTFAGLASNVKDAFSFVAASGTTKTFETVKNIAGDIFKLLVEIQREGDKIVGIRVAPALKPILEMLDRAGQIVGGVIRSGIEGVAGVLESVRQALAQNRAYVDGIFVMLRGVGETVLDVGKNILGAMSFKQPKDALQAVRAVLLFIKNIIATYGVILTPVVKIITGMVSLAGKMMTVFDGVANAIYRAAAATRQWAKEIERVSPLAALLARFSANTGESIADGLGGGTPRETPVATSALRLMRPTSALRIDPFANDLPTGNGGGGGGRGGRKFDADAAFMREMQRRIAELKDAQATEAALAEAGFDKFKDNLDRELESFKDSYGQRKLAISDYFAFVAANRQALADAEVREAERKLAANKQTYEELKRSLVESEGITDAEKKKTEIGRIENEIRDIIRARIGLESQLELATKQRGDVAVGVAREQRDAEKQLADDIAAIYANNQATIGDKFGADADRIRQEYADAVAAVQLELDKLNKIDEASLTPEQFQKKEQLQAAIAAAAATRDGKLADLELARAQNDLQFVLNELKREQADIEAQMRRDGRDGLEIEKEKIKAAEKYRDAIAEANSRIQAAAAANPTTANTDAARNANEQISQLGQTGLTVGGQIRQFLVGPLSNMFQGIITGSQTAGEAFRAFASNVIGSITQMISQMLALWAVQKLIGFISAAFGPAGAAASQGNSIGSAIGSSLVPGFADGGLVTGAGTGKSDSIPARLSNGEFVVNAARTAQYRNVLEAINSGQWEQVQQERERQILSSLQRRMPPERSAPTGIPGVGAGGASGFGEVTILNLTDRKQYLDMLRSKEGREVIGNIIGSMPNAIRRISGSRG